MTRTKKHIIVVGAGISGLTAAIELSSNPELEVTVIDKNGEIGGRARSFEWNGFHYDMGPSWYWMPEIFERFFKEHGEDLSKYFELLRLDPSYRVFFKQDRFDKPDDFEEALLKFESLQKGSSEFIRRFIRDAEFKYNAGMNTYVRTPADSMVEYFNFEVLSSFFKMDMFKSIDKEIRKGIQDEKLLQLLLFPILFLGAKPTETPALYSLMNYADLVLGTHYPKGGMIQLMNAFYQLALKKGVRFELNTELKRILAKDNNVYAIQTSKSELPCDGLIATGDYQHIDTHCLPQQYKQYDEQYWNSRKLAPSCLLFYLAIDKKLQGLLHHNLFFDTDFDAHSQSIYNLHTYPEQALFYVCVPSITDPSVAPMGKENVFILVPLSVEMSVDEAQERRLFEQIIHRIEAKTNQSIQEHILFKRSYNKDHFIEDYYSYKGNAYGLSNVISQTAFLKPKIKHKKLKNMFFAGQLSHPGPGLPPSLISGQLAAQLCKQKC
ncbi:MAG TPA: phytoene desaturase family protein [Saprospiraceae bacterium]|nr:phytoene desaturase family protein [Saprospiraceae bacterium]